MALLMSAMTWVSAQTFLSEDFGSGTFPPAGWSIDAQSGNWSAQASSNAGGTAPEARLNWSPQFNTMTRLISPATDMTGHTSATLMFKHYLDDYAGSGYSIGVATRSGGGAWNIAWSLNPTGDVGPEERIVTISNSDMGAADFQFCIYFSGNSYNIDYWYIDDVTLFVPYDLDAAMARITTPTYVGGPAPVTGSFSNLGNSTITSAQISWKVADDAIYTTTLSGLSVDFSESYDFTCDDLFHFPISAYDLEVWVSSVNGVPDDNPDNDMNSKTVNVISHSIYRKPSFEEFTSSTCAPCASFNTSFNPWTQTHADEITLVKYQMNWPGSGDPYYTAEAGTRRNYYGVSFVPWPQCNGSFVDYNITAVQAAFDEAVLQPGLAKIASTHSMNGTEITVSANILPFAGFEDARAHIIVIENKTTGNVASNGETEFHHVMMKMMPDANGTQLSLTDRVPVTITQTFDMASTNVEEFDDLTVVVIFQDYASKEIFQSEYSVEEGLFAQEARCMEITIDSEPLAGFDPDVFDYTVVLPEGTTEIPVVAATGMDPNGTVIIETTWELPGTTIVDGFGEDALTHARYNILFEIETGTGEGVAAPVVNIYPNPAKDRLMISGARNADISLISITGQQVFSVTGFTGNTIDISNLVNGMYTIRLALEDGPVVTRKISVVK
jgi:hypothetical protein